MITIGIQSGGKSTRMGTEKGLVPFCGKTLIETVINQVQFLGDELIIVTNVFEKYQHLNFQMVEDQIKDYGPLAGLQSALYFCKNPVLVNLACDIPFVNPALLKFMIKKLVNHPEIDVVIPKTAKGYEPMQAVYRKKTCLEVVNQTINQGQKRMISWFDRVNIYAVAENELTLFDPQLISFVNINTEEDLHQAELAFECPESFN